MKNKLKFNETKHEYSVGNKKLISVTQLIGKYSDKFDADKIINNMFKSSISDKIYIGKKRDYIGMRKDQINRMWKINSVSKSAYGTYIHNLAEDIANRFKENKEVLAYKDMPETKQIFNFFRKEGYEVVETELRVFSERLGVAGTVDLLLKKDNKYYIADWKTNTGKDLTLTSNFFNKMLLPPLHHIYSTEYNKYTLQMSIYRYILEEEDIYQDLEYGESFIVHLIGNIDDLKNKWGKKVIYPEMKRITYKIINTPYLKEEVESIILK